MNQSDMKVFAHRGASGYKPENTLASFRKALSMGVDMIELDVYVLGSGELVVIHDDTVDRTTEGTGHVVDFSLEQLRQLDAGHGQKIPLLREVLNLVNKRVPVNIELKSPGTAAAVAQLIAEYIDQKGWAADRFVVSSFELDELSAFIRLMPHIRSGALYEEAKPHFVSYAKRNKTYSANFDAVLVTEHDVERAHQKGLQVYVYVVNDEKEADRMRAMCVDGVFSDFPDRISAHLRAARPVRHSRALGSVVRRRPQPSLA